VLEEVNGVPLGTILFRFSRVLRGERGAKHASRNLYIHPSVLEALPDRGPAAGNIERDGCGPRVSPRDHPEKGGGGLATLLERPRRVPQRNLCPIIQDGLTGPQGLCPPLFL
jgi:hypothetical protein